MNELQLRFRSQPRFQLKQFVFMRICPEPFLDGNQPLFSFRMEGAGVMLKEKVVLDDAGHLVTGDRLQGGQGREQGQGEDDAHFL